ncbi:MAG: hypothetical protein ACLQVI_03825 [Polyangiaceae bacterium]
MRGLRAAHVCALVALGACSREDEKPRTVDLVPVYARQPYPDSGAQSGTASRTKDEPWPGSVDASPPRPFQVIVSRTVMADGGPPPKINPDDAILERARMAAGGCFRSLSAGGANALPERSAHIVFTVIPTGTVSTVDVSSADTNDDGVLGCIRQQALSTVFTDNGGGPLRTYATDVRVFANFDQGTGGGR